MPDIKDIADNANMIINGYAFTRKNECIHVLNLHCPNYGKMVLLQKRKLKHGVMNICEHLINDKSNNNFGLLFRAET